MNRAQPADPNRLADPNGQPVGPVGQPAGQPNGQANGKSVQQLPAPARPERDRPGKDRKDKRLSEFWRAMRFVLPYRRIVGISILCAFFVGLATSGGLTTIMPIMRVLLNGQTVADWANGQIVEKRLGISLAEDNAAVRVVRMHAHHAGAAAGLRIGDRLLAPGAPDGAAGATATLALLSDPGRSSAAVVRDAGGAAAPAQVALPPVPAYLQWLRHVAGHVSPHPVWAVAEVFGFLAVLSIFGNFLKFFQEYLSDKAATLAVNDIRRRLYHHVLHVPLSHFGTQGTSDVTSRLVQDSFALEQGFKTILGQSIQQPMTAAFAFGVALLTSWKLTMIIVIFGPVMGLIIQKFGKKMRRASRAALQKSALMLGQIEGTLAGIRVVKGASAERFERRRYRDIMDKLIAEQLKMSRIDAFSSPTLESLTLLMIGAIVLISTYMVCVTHTIEFPQFVLVMASLATIADSLRRLNKVNNVLQKSNAAATRVFETMDLPVERARAGRQGEAGSASGARKTAEAVVDSAGGDGANGDGGNGRGAAATAEPATHEDGGGPEALPRPRIKLPPLQREVRFENVTFTYPRSNAPALVDLSLAVPRGLSVAIVGRNGSGKTTLLALLPRFYDPQSGRITIDGVDVRDATLRSLRGQISIVTQDSVIFPGTIAQNIAYGNPLASRDQIVAAAKRAFAHEFILEKPQGYDTMLGELGGPLSGGQKQRICIARAILRNAPILILDEATSQVDADSEHLIQQAIDGLMHERSSAAHGIQAAGTAGRGSGEAVSPTTFVIAHRFSTIQSADTIVVMDRGRIVGQGRHEELLATCETYQQLYERQLFAMPPAA